MATASFRTPIISSAAPPNPRNRKNPQAAAQSNWWAPLFGFSSDPDYITSSVKIEADQPGEPGRVMPDKFRGCFTEEKAKELRKKTIESSTFHDIFYHSAIASRLAFDVSDR